MLLTLTVENKMKIKDVSVSQSNIGEISNIIVNCGLVKTIDGGDHVINIWESADGRLNVSIQGTGDQVTLLAI